MSLGPGPYLFVQLNKYFRRVWYKKNPGHDTAISQIYGYQNWVHEPTYQANHLRN